jgi:hypothetical protein
VTSGTLRAYGRFKVAVVRKFRGYPFVPRFSRSSSDLFLENDGKSSPHSPDDNSPAEAANSPFQDDRWSSYDTTTSHDEYLGEFHLDTPQWKDLEYSNPQKWIDSPSHVREILCLCLWRAKEWFALALEQVPLCSGGKTIYRRVGVLVIVGVSIDNPIEYVDWFAGTEEQLVKII